MYVINSILLQYWYEQFGTDNKLPTGDAMNERELTVVIWNAYLYHSFFESHETSNPRLAQSAKMYD